MTSVAAEPGSEVRDDVVGVDDLHVVDRLDVARGDGAFPALLQGKQRLLPVVHLQDNALQVQQEIHDVFLHAVECRVLVQHARDLDLGRSETGHGGQQGAPQGVAQGVAVAALERLHRELGVVRRNVLHVDDAGLQKSDASHGFGPQ